MQFQIKFVVAPDHLLKQADEILRATILTTNAQRGIIRAVAKAYIDEADEIKRGAEELRRNAGRAQLQTLSPPEMIAKAKSLELIVLSNKRHQEKVRAIAKSYVHVAAENQRLFDEFVAKYGDHLPPRKE
jgi:hypothetical protein